MELYSKAKYKQLAIEYALKLGTSTSAEYLVEQAKKIEEYLSSDAE